jgi:ABC-type phosphate transport system ATPase subunit
LIEFGKTEQIFQTPTNELTERYISGKFGWLLELNTILS